VAVNEVFYRQLVLKEMEKLATDQTPIRLYFAPGSATYQQLRLVASHKNMETRAVVELAVKALFLAIFGGETSK
jgi:hypothetical protein